jgi:hypothetical protein
MEETPFRRIPKFMDLWLKVKARRGKGTPKNREMKEEPTMLLITKDRLWEPTMFMKTQMLAQIGHDPYENTDFILCSPPLSTDIAKEAVVPKKVTERSRQTTENK